MKCPAPVYLQNISFTYFFFAGTCGLHLLSLFYYAIVTFSVVSNTHMNMFVCLFELMLYVPVNRSGHIGTLPPFYGTFTHHYDVMTGLEIFLRTYSSCGASCKQFSLVLNAGALVLKIWISKETKIIKN